MMKIRWHAQRYLGDSSLRFPSGVELILTACDVGSSHEDHWKHCPWADQRSKKENYQWLRKQELDKFSICTEFSPKSSSFKQSIAVRNYLKEIIRVGRTWAKKRFRRY